MSRLEAEQAIRSSGQIMEALKDELDGWTAFTYYGPKENKEKVRRLIDNAVKDRFDVTITYYTAGRNQVTKRRITPYVVKKRKGVDYVRAMCRERMSERLFRLDRIIGIEKSSEKDDAGSKDEDFWDGRPGGTITV